MQQQITNAAGLIPLFVSLHSLLGEIIQFYGFKHHVCAEDL